MGQLSKLFLQILPKAYLSHAVGFLCDLKAPSFILQPAIKTFCNAFNVNMDDSKSKIHDFQTFNEFFTRELKRGARKIDNAKNAIVSPVDGKILSFGKLKYDTLIQAKGIHYSAFNLLKDEKTATNFIDGDYIALYLAPKNYHRIHSPFDIKVEKSIRIPGNLFPVNSLALHHVNNLFPQNERLISVGKSRIGKIAIAKVGATNVGRIKLSYKQKYAKLKKGQELGYFEMGSAVILLFEKNKIQFSKNIKAGKEVLFGQKIAVTKK
jgi:phosphatidylserine decarboxylase